MTTFYPYATPISLRDSNLGAAVPPLDAEAARFVQSLKTLQVIEVNLVAMYGNLLIAHNLGGVPRLLLDRYNAHAAGVNQIYRFLHRLAIEMGQSNTLDNKLIFQHDLIGTIGDVSALAVVPANKLLFPDPFPKESPPQVLSGWPLIVGIAIAAGTIAFTAHTLVRANVLKHRANIAKAEAEVELARQRVAEDRILTDAMANLTTKCVGDKVGDVAAFLKCMEAVAPELQKIQAQLPNTDVDFPPEKGGGLGFLGTIGLVVLAAGIGIGLYAVWRNRKDREIRESRLLGAGQDHCSCGEAEAHVIARRRTMDGYFVELWSDGSILTGNHKFVRYPAKRRVKQRVDAGRKLMENAPIMSFDEFVVAAKTVSR